MCYKSFSFIIKAQSLKIGIISKTFTEIWRMYFWRKKAMAENTENIANMSSTIMPSSELKCPNMPNFHKSCHISAFISTTIMFIIIVFFECIINTKISNYHNFKIWFCVDPVLNKLKLPQILNLCRRCNFHKAHRVVSSLMDLLCFLFYFHNWHLKMCFGPRASNTKVKTKSIPNYSCSSSSLFFPLYEKLC